MEAVRALNDAGIPTGVLMAPILPGITDKPRMLRQVVEAAIEARATYLSPILLHLRPGVREEFMPWLSREYPDLVPRYHELYPRAYASTAARKELGRRVSSIVRAMGGLDPGVVASGRREPLRYQRPAPPRAIPRPRSSAWSERPSATLPPPMTGTDTLLTLQGVDTAIDRATTLRNALESGETLTAARAEADRAEAVVGELRLQVDEMSRDQMRFEHEIDSLSQKEAAESKRMYDGSVANAKELEAMQHETESLKRRRSEREDELLALLEQREELDARVAAAETVGTGLRTEVDRTAVGAADQLVTVTADLERLAAERTQLAAQIDPELVELYDDLRRQKKGVGAATLVDGVCSGCHEQLSSMQLDKLKRTEGIRRCEHCRRILIF